jgi:hypothetical protein
MRKPIRNTSWSSTQIALVVLVLLRVRAAGFVLPITMAQPPPTGDHGHS